MGFLDTYDNLTQLHEAKYTVYNGHTYKDYFYPPQARKSFWQDVKHNPPRVYTDIFHIGYDEDIPDELKDSLFNEYGELESPGTWGQISKLDDTQWWVKALKKFWWIQFKAPDKEIISQARRKAEQDERNRLYEEKLAEREAALNTALATINKIFEDELDHEALNKLESLYSETATLFAEAEHCPYIMPQISSRINYDYDKIVDNPDKSSTIWITYYSKNYSDKKSQAIESKDYDKIDSIAHTMVQKLNKMYNDLITYYTKALLDAENGQKAFPEYYWYKDFYNWAIKNTEENGTFWFQDHEYNIYAVGYTGDINAFMNKVEQQDIPISARLAAFNKSEYRKPFYARDEYRTTRDRVYDEYVSFSKVASPALLAKLHITEDGDPVQRGGWTDVSSATKYKKEQVSSGRSLFYPSGMDMWIHYTFSRLATD